MVIRRLAPMSFAKVVGVLYALLGLVFGAMLSLVSWLGMVGPADDKAPGSFLFGPGAIVLLPILYGGFGFIFTAISAALYNMVAGFIGGVEIEVQ